MGDKYLAELVFCSENPMSQLTQTTPKTSGVFFEDALTQVTGKKQRLNGHQANRPLALRHDSKTGFKPVVLVRSAVPRMKARNQLKKVAASPKKIREVFAPIYEAVQLITEDAKARMRRPVGVMLRFTLTTDSSPATVMQRMAERFTRGGTLAKPGYVWVREVRAKDYQGLACAYDHYHAVLLLDQSHYWLPTLIKALEALQARGHLESWHISRDAKGLKVHDLSSAEGSQGFFWHASYLAKVETKQHCFGRRLYGRSQCKAADKLPLPVPKRAKARPVRTEEDRAIEAASRQRKKDYLQRCALMLASIKQEQG